MEKIKKIPKRIRSLLKKQENINNLKEWIEFLICPFKKSTYAPHCFTLASVLHPETLELLPDTDKDLVRICFPTTISGLYLKTDEDQSDEGYLVLSIENRARIYFVTKKHSVSKYEQIFSERKSIEGTYEQVVEIYLQYLNELMTIPTIIK